MINLWGYFPKRIKFQKTPQTQDIWVWGGLQEFSSPTFCPGSAVRSDQVAQDLVFLSLWENTSSFLFETCCPSTASLGNMIRYLTDSGRKCYSQYTVWNSLVSVCSHWFLSSQHTALKTLTPYQHILGDHVRSLAEVKMNDIHFHVISLYPPKFYIQFIFSICCCHTQWVSVASCLREFWGM